MNEYSANMTIFPVARDFLTGRGANSTSQFGCDGLVEASLERFGFANRWCFEVGAHDGLYLSNTHRLRCHGWNAILIESDPELFSRLISQQSPTVRCVHEKINETSLDRILEVAGAPSDLDFGVIDIDGQDYWAWCGMRRFQPRLMLVEFEYGSDDHDAKYPPLNGPGQANCKAIESLGISKGYTALAKTPCNLLFVKSELL